MASTDSTFTPCGTPFGSSSTTSPSTKSTPMVPEGCEADVVRLLSQLSRRPVVPDGDPEAALDSRQNAEIVAGAERYCRTMVGGDGESWNVRDHHMTDTLERLMDHHGGASKAVVWEHNSHIGDAPGRRTWRGLAWSTSGSSSGAPRRRCCAGRLRRPPRQRHRRVLLGFADAPFSAPPAPGGTHEALVHEERGDDPTLFVFPHDRSGPWLVSRRGHRAIGVVYDPALDRYGN